MGVARLGVIFHGDERISYKSGKQERRMILSRNSDVKGIVVKAIEGKPMYGGDLIVKPLIKGDEMTFLEIHYTPGVGAPLHVHSHESLAYVVKGKVKMTVGKEEFILGPGDVCRHPKGVPHGVEGIEESIVVEVKSPAPEISAFLGM
ncbi:MAG TPA: cupin domain-containing protein [Candidatus Binatia bacterium]|nr:cupin domain-containing protein [Candidatus Binatia bacterium]